MLTSLALVLAEFADYFPYPKLQGLGLVILIALVWFLIWSKKRQT
jgi:hypothetical protein